MTRLPTLMALLAAGWVLTCGVLYGTRAVGGSDSSCYGLMAQALAAGSLQPRSPWVREAPWPRPEVTAAPGGFIPSPVDVEAASPICAPGFAVLVAPLMAMVGPAALFWINPVCGAALVWCAFVLGSRIGTPWSGAFAAVLVGTMPVLLYQVVQPMNDAAGAAFWIAGLAVLVAPGPPRPRAAGLLVAVALLIRPNLLPVAAMVTVLALWRWGPWPALRCGLVVVPGGLLVLALNSSLYGGPLESGYGAVTSLFAASHIGANALQYGRAIIETQLAVPLLGLAAPWLLTGSRRRTAVVVLAVASTVLACYAAYTPFPEWWYLRFLLPALVGLTVLAAVAAGEMASRVSPRYGTVALCLVTLVAAAVQLSVARQRAVFDLQALEARFRLAGEALRDRWPRETIALAVWDSGSLRFHAGRDVVMWDALDPQWLDDGVRWLADQGRSPVLVIERWEEPAFRARFTGQEWGALDWPPRLDVDSRVRVFVFADRERHLSGEAISTESIWR